ncbi:hypothetical protein ACFXNW_29215 [Nocardia sp. NPDC059180]|uniref:hypothetical protein n=1 Tax=Nocardia sp. NPDC059180 TaxID=3346761 RepID=UPI0036C84E1E
MVVGEFQAKLPIDFKFFVKLRFPQDFCQTTQRFSRADNLLARHTTADFLPRLQRTNLGFGQIALRLHFADPLTDHHGVSISFKRRPVFPQLPVEDGQRLAPHRQG